MATPIPVKSTTAYTWDWYCHLVGDRALINTLAYFSFASATTKKILIALAPGHDVFE
jgi:hypothetical protein